MKEFLQKRWVRVAGIFPMAFYSYLAIMSVYIVVSETFFRPVHKIFPMTDGIGWLGYLFFLSIVGCSGILAIITAYYMKGIFKVLYIAGAMAIISSAAYLPLSFIFCGEHDLYPEFSGEEFLCGKWINDSFALDLKEDNTYSITFYDSNPSGKDKLKYEGTWKLKHHEIFLDGLEPNWNQSWDLTWGNGYYFITYSISDNLDAWDGNLGLMREQDWLETH
ncbi:MAG: hypothetical protein ABIJ12_13795 [bacterium]